MTDGFSAEQIHDFGVGLQNFRNGLADHEKPLFDAIVKLAWRATAAEEHLSAGFQDSFEPLQADLLVAYDRDYAAAAGGGQTVTHIHLIKP
jgi:hypothetical protein